MNTLLRTPLLKYALALGFGVGIGDYYSLPLWIFPLVLFLLLASRLKNLLFRSLGVLLGFALLGNFTISLNKYAHYPTINQSNYTDYQARILKPCQEKARTRKCECELLSYYSAQWVPTKGRVLLYFPKEENIQPGSVYLVKGRVGEIDASKNLFEFDYKNYLAHQNIYIQHFIKKGYYKKIGFKKIIFFVQFTENIRKHSNETLNSVLHSKPKQGIAQALFTGTKDHLDPEVRLSFTAAGAVHILAVSGMHVGLILLSLLFILDLAQIKKPLIRTLLVVICIWFYAVFTGFSPSVVRATLMFTFIEAGLLFQKEKNSLNSLAFSFIVLLSLWPNWLFNVGFQLSYLAMFGILTLYPLVSVPYYWPYLIRSLAQLSIISIAAQLFTLPLSIYYFQQFPNYFLLANPIVAVLSTIALYAGNFFLLFHKIPFLSQMSSAITDLSIGTLYQSVQFFEQLPYSVSSDIFLDIPSLVFSYGMIFTALFCIFEKSYPALKWMTIFGLILVLKSIYREIYLWKQQEITYHYIPKSAGISVISGKSALFLSPDSLTTDPATYQYYLKKYYAFKGVSDLKTVTLDNKNLLFTIRKKNYLWVQTKAKDLPQIPIHRLIVSNNIPLKYQSLVANGIVLDGSNRLWFTNLNHWTKNTINLYKQGSLTEML